MATYHLEYRDDDGDHHSETDLELDDVVREDGIVELWRGKDVIMRLQEKHVVKLDRVDA